MYFMLWKNTIHINKKYLTSKIHKRETALSLCSTCLHIQWCSAQCNHLQICIYRNIWCASWHKHYGIFRTYKLNISGWMSSCSLAYLCSINIFCLCMIFREEKSGSKPPLFVVLLNIRILVHVRQIHAPEHTMRNQNRSY